MTTSASWWRTTKPRPPKRAAHHRRLLGFAQYRKIHTLDVAQTAYHASWFIPAVRELAAAPDFRPDPAWVANALLPPITKREAKHALRVLLDLGLLVKTESGLAQSEPLLTTGGGPQGHHVADYHRAMMQRAAESIDAVPREDRDISSVTLCVSEAALPRLKARIAQLQSELMQESIAEPRPTRVVQVNFQMFPLSQPESER